MDVCKPMIHSYISSFPRLAADGDDDVDKSPMGSLQDGGIQFHVNDGVINVNTTSSPLLPRKVMEEM